MSKESLRNSIESKKKEILRIRAEITVIRERKKEISARYSANIKNATSPASKASYRNQKATAVGYCDSQIRGKQTTIESLKRQIASFRERMKYEK